MKAYTKSQIAKVLSRVGDHLADHTAKFPALIPVCLAMTEAIKDPTKMPKGIVVAEPSVKAKKAKAVNLKAVSINYEGAEIIVENVPFGAAHYALNRIFGAIKEGAFHQAPGKEWDGDVKQ